MGARWGYRLRKVDMAWELASRKLFDRPATQRGLPPSEDYYRQAKRELQEAWDVVNSVFPSFEE